MKGKGALENKICFNQGIRRHDQRNSHQGNSRVRGGAFEKKNLIQPGDTPL